MSISNSRRIDAVRKAVANRLSPRLDGVLPKGVLAGLLVVTAPTVLSAAEFTESVSFTIPSQPLTSALMQFADQSRIQVITSAVEIKQLQTQGVQGRVTIEEALRQLLDGTGLSFRKVGEGTVTIAPNHRVSPDTPAVQPVSYSDSGTRPLTHLARASAATTGVGAGKENDSRHDESTSEESLTEVTVTGSRINRIDRSVPLTTITREQIEMMGVTNAGELLRRIPQNVSDVSQNTMNGHIGGTSSAYTFEGAGVNLRGLGASSTLVLVNGRRMIGGGNGSFTDVSMIPFSAIERIEIMADGASAIYGSDAVGGVINFILKRDFDARETSLRYGVATRGGAEQFMASQTMANGWDRGGVQAHVEYSHTTPVRSEDRDFVQEGAFGFMRADLLPANEQVSVILSGRRDLTEALDIDADATYADRRTTRFTEFDNGWVDMHNDSEQYGAQVSVGYRINDEWSVRATPQYSVSSSKQGQSRSDMAGYLVPYGNELTAATLDVDLKRTVDSAGIGFATGVQLRREGFEERSPYYPADIERDVTAFYMEARVPMLEAEQSRSPLELSLAARYEDYEHAGSAVSPKIGLSWQPTRELNLRTTWGKSFRAPVLTQTNVADVYGSIYRNYFLTHEGEYTAALMLGGNNGDLDPERSNNWTAGVDWSLPHAGVRVSATYFDIRYRDRIQSPDFNAIVAPGAALISPILAELVTMNPSRQELEQWIASTRFSSCYDMATASACDTAAAIAEGMPIIGAFAEHLPHENQRHRFRCEEDALALERGAGAGRERDLLPGAGTTAVQCFTDEGRSARPDLRHRGFPPARSRRRGPQWPERIAHSQLRR